jgi:predicted regulator of Ras-like GTPase activity (Roadblock/LC7/MglB family)
VDVADALRELTELSSQIERAVVLDSDGGLMGSTVEDGAAAERLAEAARGLLAAAAELRPAAEAVTSAEVELSSGGFFVLHEGGRTIAATTGPGPTAGLVMYDLRTCLRALEEPETPEKPKRRRSRVPKKEAAG